MFYPLTVRDFIDRAETVYPDRVAVVDEPDQPAASLGHADLSRAGRPGPGPGRAARPAGGAGRWPRGGGVAQQRPAAELVLRRQRVGPGAGAGQLPVERQGDPVHRRPLRRRRGVRRPRALGRARRPRRHPQVRDRRRRRALPARRGTTPLGRPGRGCHRDHQLHLGDHRPPQGRAADPPQPVAQRDRLRAAHRRQRPRRLPAHAADVPRQRVGHALRDHGDGRPPRGAAQGRRRGDPAPHRPARRHAHVRRPRRDQRRPRGGRVLGGRDPRPGPGPHRRRGRPSPDPDHRAGHRGAGLGVQPDLRTHRDLAAA